MSDKYLTTPATATTTTTKTRKGPHATIRHGSVGIPIYAGTTGGKTRYTIAFHLDGKRQRRMFTDLDEAKREAKLAAEKIQRGLAANNDLSTREREIFHAARKLLQPLDVPIMAAIEEYVRARVVLKDLPLVTAAQEFMRQNEGVKLGVTVPEICNEMVAAKGQDSVSQKYVKQLKWDLKSFSTHFPGPIRHVKSQEIDRLATGAGIHSHDPQQYAPDGEGAV